MAKSKCRSLVLNMSQEFMFIFRTDYQAMPQDSPEEMQATAKKWQDWIGSIAAQNKLVETQTDKQTIQKKIDIVNNKIPAPGKAQSDWKH